MMYAMRPSGGHVATSSNPGADVSREKVPPRGSRLRPVFDQLSTRSGAPMRTANERRQRTFITMKVRSSYCSASRIQSFIASESRALISLAER